MELYSHWREGIICFTFSSTDQCEIRVFLGSTSVKKVTNYPKIKVSSDRENVFGSLMKVYAFRNRTFLEIAQESSDSAC